MKKKILNDQLATKGDLKKLRTELKGDMKGLRTEFKGDMKDVKGNIKSLEGRFDGLNARFDGLNARFDLQGERTGRLEENLEEKFNLLVTHIDGLAKLVKEALERWDFHDLLHGRQEKKLESHETRISRLETAVIH